ncbi:MAG: hypothetical protein PVI78_11910, partial [Anaerolineales bacterium]
MPDQDPVVKMKALRPTLGDVVATLEQSAPYGSVLLSHNQGLQIYVDNRQEIVSERDPTAGTVLTAFDGLTMRERALGGFDRRAILREAKVLASEGGFAMQQEIDPGPKRKGDFATPMKLDLSKMTTEEKLERLRELNARVNKLDERIVNVRIIYREISQNTVFINRAADLAQDTRRVLIYIYAFTSGEKGIRFDWKSKQASAGWEALTFSDEELQDLAEKAIALHNAERIEPGE